ncbi:hypothetical protein Tco_0528557 [Tanacetum coccineum]
MAAPVISISSDTSDESVGSPISQVILFGSIPIEVPIVPADLPIAPEVRAAVVASPARVLKLDTHSSSKSDTEFPERRVSSTPHDAMHILVGRLYRTHPGGPCRALTTRKMVGPLPSHRLALRHSSPSLPLGIRPRLWLRSPVSGTRFSSTVESSPSDSPDTTSDRRSHSPPYSAGPSRKRCRSPTTTMPSSIPASRALSPTRVDLLPPYKRFRDSYSSEDSIEEDINPDVLANIEVDAAATEAASDMDFEVEVEVEVDADIGIEVDVEGEDEDEHEGESSHRGTIEIRVDVVAEIDISVGMLMPDAVEYLDQLEEGNMIITRSGMTPEDIEELIAQIVAKALATYEASCAAELVVKSQSHNRDDGDNGNGRGNGDENGGGNENGN